MVKVKGYMLRTSEMREKGQEQLFALYEDGTIKTCIRELSSSFNEKHNKWIDTKSIPNEAHFIGTYELKGLDTSKYCSTCRSLLNENYECEDCIENE